MPRHPTLAAFIRERAIEVGRFRLASGLESSYYCDGKRVSFSGEGLNLATDAILSELRAYDVEAVGGMDMGATPIVAAVALRAFQTGASLDAFVVRKAAKQHGSMKQIEGVLPSQPSRVAIVDDVVTTGGSIIQAIERVRELGHHVVVAICMLDRDSGGAEALAQLGVTYQPLVTITELGLTNDAPAVG